MTFRFLKTLSVALLCSLTILSSCSDNEDPKVPVVFETTTAIKAGAFDDVSVQISGFNPASHVVRVNGQPVEVIQGAGNEVVFNVPFQVGSGKIEVVNGSTTIMGPDFIYDKTFVGFTGTSVVGSSMAGTRSNSIIAFDPSEKAFRQLAYNTVAFDDGDMRVILNASKVTTTVPNSTLAVWRIAQTLGMAVNAANGIYFAHLYRKEASQSSPVYTPILYSASAGAASSSVYGDPVAPYDEIIDMEVNANNELYTIEKGKPYIRKNTLSSVSILAGSETAGLQDGTGTAARFTSINAITIDNAGNLFVADGNAIRKVTPSGVVTTLAGGAEEGNVDGPAAQARFRKIVGIYWRNDGTLYIADNGNNIIKTLKDGTVTSLRHTTGSIAAEAVTMPMFVDSKGVIFTMNGGRNNPLVVFVPEFELSEQMVEQSSMTSGFFSTEIRY